MKKLKKYLPYFLAVLIVVVSYLGVEFSQLLLPDYKDSIEQIDLSDKKTMLYLNDSKEENIWPWTYYEKNKDSLVKEKDYDFTNELITSLISTYSPHLIINYESPQDGYDFQSIDFSKELESINTNEGEMYFLKDFKIFSSDKKSLYILNVSFNSSSVFYYSCIQDTNEKAEFQTVKDCYDMLQSDYEQCVLHLQDNYFYGTEYIEYLDTSICFESFLHKTASYAGKFVFLPNVQEFYNAIIYSQKPEISYYAASNDNKTVLNVEFSTDTCKLILFYDIFLKDFAGFSVEYFGMDSDSQIENAVNEQEY